jgi:hypothetical protein
MAGGWARDSARVRGTDPGGAAPRLAVPFSGVQAKRFALRADKQVPEWCP